MINMLTGMVSCSRVPEVSVCRTVEPYFLTVVGDYKIHATTLMSQIPFAAPAIIPKPINSIIFINDASTKLSFANTLQTQNYLTCHFVGRAPFAFYGPATPAGKDIFHLRCPNGDPSKQLRSFGTKGAIGGGDNDSANSMITYKR